MGNLSFCFPIFQNLLGINFPPCSLVSNCCSFQSVLSLLKQQTWLLTSCLVTNTRMDQAAMNCSEFWGTACTNERCLFPRKRCPKNFYISLSKTYQKAESCKPSLFIASFTSRSTWKEEYFQECGMNISTDSYNGSGGKMCQSSLSRDHNLSSMPAMLQGVFLLV